MEQAEVKDKFDFQVTHRDTKTGQIVKQNAYTQKVVKTEDGGKTSVMERPVGSGNLWNKKNEAVGRWVFKNEKDKQGFWDKDAKHVEFVVPDTQDQKLQKSLIEKDIKLQAALKELEAIKAEKEAKNKPAVTAKVKE